MMNLVKVMSSLKYGALFSAISFTANAETANNDLLTELDMITTSATSKSAAVVESKLASSIARTTGYDAKDVLAYELASYISYGDSDDDDDDVTMQDTAYMVVEDSDVTMQDTAYMVVEDSAENVGAEDSIISNANESFKKNTSIYSKVAAFTESNVNGYADGLADGNSASHADNYADINHAAYEVMVEEMSADHDISEPEDDHIALIGQTTVAKDDYSDYEPLLSPSEQSEALASLAQGSSAYSSTSAYDANNRTAAINLAVSELKQAQQEQLSASQFSSTRAHAAALAQLASQVAKDSVGSRMGLENSVSSQDLTDKERYRVEKISKDGRVHSTIFAPPGGIERSKLPGLDVNRVLVSQVTTTERNTIVHDDDEDTSLDAIRFMGIELIDAPEFDNASLKAQLAQKIKPFEGRALNAELLQDVGNTIKEFYRKEGYLNCETYMPQQDINLDHAVFKIGVKGAELNQAHIENQSFVSDSYLEYLLGGIRKLEGQTINYNTLFGQMLKLNDLGTFALQGQFDAITPDNIVNNLDLMALKGIDRTYFTAAVDNFGSQSSGRYRYSGSFEILSPTGSADRLNLFYSHTNEEQADYSIGYAIPINSHPSLLGATLCYSHADLGGIYRQLGTKNEELTFEAFLREPLYRTSNAIANLQFGYVYRKMTTDFSVFDLKTKKHSNTAYLQLSGSKDFVGNALISSSVRLSAGRIVNDDDYELGIDGNFVKLNGNVGYNYILGENFSTVTNIDVQLSNTILDGSEVMQAGGENGLLAYQSADLCGDSGIVVKQSLQYMPNVNWGLVIAPHIEAGKLFTHDYEAQRAASAGISLMYSRYGVNAMFDVSHVLGNKLDYVEDSSRLNFKFSYTF